MTTVPIFLTILASAILIFTSYYLKNYMRNIHYTILKSIGMLSGFLVLFSIFIPEKLNWRYSDMSVIFIGILVLYYFVWKYTLVHQQNKNINEFPVDWTVFLVGLFVSFVPLSVKLHTIMPKKLFWVHFLIIFAQLSAFVPVILRLVKRYKTRMQGTIREKMELRQFQIYNSLTKRKEIFKSIVPGKVSLYICGITSYDYIHMGHARAYVVFDLLYRYLRHLGYEVKYVRNFTDVDDKIIKRANEGDPLALSARFCQEFLTDMADLQCLPPTEQPRVSDHMDQIRDMIAKIINNGCAYVVEEGDVYFSVKSSPNYGCLSGRNSEDNNRAGERIVIDPRKKNPADFALWKAAKNWEISWDSPWGKGRPRWHIECSALSATYLTEKFGIHV